MRLVYACGAAAIAAFFLSPLYDRSSLSSPLSSESQAFISGLSQPNKSESASDACEDTTTAGSDDVPEYLCPLYPNGTVCVSCTCGSAVTGVANTTGGPGLTPTQIHIACNNCTGKVGLCDAGSCDLMAPGGCSGSPYKWNTQ